MTVALEATLHTRIKPVKRSEGRNAVRSAAYRSGSLLTCERTGESWDYSNRRGVEHTEILAPEGAPAWATDRETLWNRAENAERRKDSQVAREYEFLFSYDLTPDQRAALAREVASEEFVARGMVADIAVHRYGRAWKAGKEGTEETISTWRAWGLPFLDEATSARSEMQHVMVTHGRDGEEKAYYLFQPHCHIQLTMRPLSADGEKFEKKSAGSVARSWNDQASYDGIRCRSGEWVQMREPYITGVEGVGESIVTLKSTSGAVTFEGRCLGELRRLIRHRKVDFVQEFDPARWQSPAPGLPVIERITIHQARAPQRAVPGSGVGR